MVNFRSGEAGCELLYPVTAHSKVYCTSHMFWSFYLGQLLLVLRNVSHRWELRDVAGCSSRAVTRRYLVVKDATCCRVVVVCCYKISEASRLTVLWSISQVGLAMRLTACECVWSSGEWMNFTVCWLRAYVWLLAMYLQPSKECRR